MGANAGHRISEVSARTGFSASALRFYEGAGLVHPGRTPAGYRVYDDRTIERLRFVARAKELGLRLDDIAELLPVWEGDRCADVAGHLAARVADKAIEARARISQLTAFASELEAAGRRLAIEVDDGPCSGTCACTPGPHAAPITCSLGPGQVIDRVDDWRRLLASLVGLPRRTTDGATVSITVTLAPDPATAGRAAALAAAEQACCAFIDFDLSITRTGIELTATAPTEGEAVLDALLGDLG
ncbi:hypothetical protein BH10ACT1_BH10ACT1_11690 [soil metagenome]